MADVRQIARAPHPVGSEEHDRVRDYLLHRLEALGLQPSVQKTTSILPSYGSAATVENIVALLPGREHRAELTERTALLLAAHYDSAPTGPGAGDDAAGVATLLETARALSAGPPLRNDVIFLFSDGEELGLLGAAAFVSEHPWKKRAALALNFDNRGSRGTVVMYETGRGNLPLMREFARAVPVPRATSLAGAIARQMPNSTDFFVLRRAGITGFNFAFIGGPEDYHSREDTPERLSLASLQQDGDYALPLARRLADADFAALAAPSDPAGPDAIYFNAGNYEVVYPQSWTRPLAIAALLVFLLVVALAIRSGAARPGSFALAFALLPTSVIAAWRAGDWLVLGLSREPGESILLGASGRAFFHPVYAVALSILAAGLVFALWELSGVRRLEAGLAGAGAWSALGILLAFQLPAASYVAFWPLLPMLIAEGVICTWSRCPRALAAALCWLAAIPAVALLAPLLPMLHLALGMSMPGAAALAMVTALGCWLLAPLVAPNAKAQTPLAPVFLLAGAACILVGLGTVRYDAQHPQPEWVAYVQDADHGTARWMSPADPHRIGAPRLDSWLRQYLGEHPQVSSFPISAGIRGASLAWEHPAPQVALEAPQAALLEESRKDGMRTLRILLTSPRHATRLAINASASLFGVIRLNGHDVDQPAPGGKAVVRAEARAIGDRHMWSMLYSAPPANGLEATFEVPVGEPFELAIADISDGLPAIPGYTFAPRPPNVTQQFLADVTLVFRHFTF